METQKRCVLLHNQMKIDMVAYIQCILCLLIITMRCGAIEEHIQCYNDDAGNRMRDISDEDPLNNSIFFHETSCASARDKKISITARQACSVESAARLHPNRTVYLLYNAPIKFKIDKNYQDINDKLVDVLREYPNVHIRRLSISRYVKDTPLEWFGKKEIQSSDFPVIHTSDVLRYLTLWKYGGTYMDLDVVVTKNLEELGSNFAGRASSNTINSAVLNFEPRGIGHGIVEDCLSDITQNFDGKKFTHNGPRVLKRVLIKRCKSKEPKDWSYKKCKGFDVLDYNIFYPLPWQRWGKYFDPNIKQQILLKTASSYVVHIWNKVSKGRKPIDVSDVAYGALAEKYCPNVYQESNHIF